MSSNDTPTIWPLLEANIALIAPIDYDAWYELDATFRAETLARVVAAINEFPGVEHLSYAALYVHFYEADNPARVVVLGPDGRPAARLVVRVFMREHGFKVGLDGTHGLTLTQEWVQGALREAMIFIREVCARHYLPLLPEQQ